MLLSQNKDSCHIALHLLASAVFEIIIECSNTTNKSRPVVFTTERFNNITCVYQITAPQPHQDTVQQQPEGEQLAEVD